MKLASKGMIGNFQAVLREIMKRAIEKVSKEYCELCQKYQAKALADVKEQINSNFLISTSLICIFISALGLLIGFHII